MGEQFGEKLGEKPRRLAPDSEYKAGSLWLSEYVDMESFSCTESKCSRFLAVQSSVEVGLLPSLSRSGDAEDLSWLQGLSLPHHSKYTCERSPYLPFL